MCTQHARCKVGDHGDGDINMASPYVRRLRLAQELSARLKASRRSQQDLARQLSWDRSKVTRLLNGDAVRPNESEVVAVLNALEVSGDEFARLRAMARDAAHRGWWVGRAKRMGERQAVHADLESGAATIREYQQTWAPGLLQTPDYVRALTRYDDLTLPGVLKAELDAEVMIKGRAQRQLMRQAPDGPTYEVVIDEGVLMRPTAPLEILATQLRHLAAVSDKTTVYVLPKKALIDAYSVPRSSFSLFTYADPGDGTIVLEDCVTSDLVLNDPEGVKPYEVLYARLKRAALPADESARLLEKAADEMMKGIMS
ncbi:helix-turn-helix transcriptional regulator [Actinopolymorpha pittospori]